MKDCPVFCSWSGGKDSCLALHRAVLEGARPVLLFTMLEENGERSRSHGLSKELLKSHARTLGIPLTVRCASWDDYESVFSSALVEFKKQGLEAGVFGDIDIEDHRRWVERVCASAGLRPYHPLWKKARMELLREMLDLGFEAMIVVVREGVMDKRFLGRILDRELIEELAESGVDPCGEFGEFHTVVTNGPNFKYPLKIELKGQVLRDGCWLQEVALSD